MIKSTSMIKVVGMCGPMGLLYVLNSAVKAYPLLCPYLPSTKIIIIKGNFAMPMSGYPNSAEIVSCPLRASEIADKAFIIVQS